MSQLQPLLGLDKSSPLLEVLIDPKYPDEALVHFGTRLLETVRLGRDSVEAKLLAGRLYNAGFKRKTLADEFPWDIKTIRAYGDALKSGSAEALSRALAGQGAPRKVDGDVNLFIRATYREVHAEMGCHSNAHIQKELKIKKDVSLSRESIRQIINDEAEKISTVRLVENESEEPDEQDGKPVISDCCGENICNTETSSGSDSLENCKHSPSNDSSEEDLTYSSIQLLHHGGLFLVRAFIDRVTNDLPDSMVDLFRQWTAAVLCGCVNIEQMGALNYPSLEIIIGPQLNSRSAQREALLQCASAELIADLRQCNLEFLDIPLSCPAFLYDPHGIEYTGQLKLLKGWLGGSHRIGKASYQDFIHTLDGRPMVAFLDDNRSSLLKRLPENVCELRSLLGLPENAPITLIVDRAVYSLSDLIEYRDKYHIYIITWEKNCTRPPWAPPDKEKVQYLYIPKPRNNSKDVIMYKAEFYSQPWGRDNSVIQYTLRLHKGDAEPITLSILSTCPEDLTLKTTAQLKAILTRWVQENNIGYLITHNGINEITSYQSYTYEQAAARLDLDDYTIDNPDLRKLSSQKLKLSTKEALLTVKLKDRKQYYDNDQKEKSQELSEVEQQLTQASSQLGKELRKRRASLKRSLKSLPERRQKAIDKLSTEIEVLNNDIATIDERTKETPREVQRLEYIISNEYDRLNFAPKALMDAIRILAHNIHRQLHREFRPIYNNYRDDHRILRELIQAPAFLEETPQQYNITIIPSRIYGKAVDAILEMIDHLSEIETVTGKPICLTLQEPLQGIQFAI